VFAPAATATTPLGIPAVLVVTVAVTIHQQLHTTATPKTKITTTCVVVDVAADVAFVIATVVVVASAVIENMAYTGLGDTFPLHSRAAITTLVHATLCAFFRVLQPTILCLFYVVRGIKVNLVRTDWLG
jgi:hypothetical protein